MLYGSVGRVGLRALLGSVAFTPLSLFAAGEQGAWLDNSDFTTLFQDAAGTTPVTGYEQFVGLRLDKSKSGVGTNGARRVNLLSWTEAFENAAWLLGSNMTVSSGVTYSGINIQKLTNIGTNANQYKYQTFTVPTSTTYTLSAYASYGDAPYVVLLITDGVANGLRKGFNVQTGVVGATQNIGSGWTLVGADMTPLGSGIYRLRMTVTSASSTRLDAGCHPAVDADNSVSSTTGKFNNVGGFQLEASSSATTYQRITDTWYNTIPGNHAYQTNINARAVLSARYNLLTQTEAFDNAAWSLGQLLAFGSGSTVNATTAPNGTTTADLITPNTTFAPHSIWQAAATVASGVSYTAIWHVKPNGYTKMAIVENEVTGYYTAYDASGSGSMLSQSNATGTITALADGWYRITHTSVSSGTLFRPQLFILRADYTFGSVTSSWTPNGTSGLYIWGADLRATSESSALPAYQRVGAAVNGTSTSIGTPDYDTVGFPAYLRYDGGDWYQTNSIDFSTGATNPPLGSDVFGGNGNFDTPAYWVTDSGCSVSSGLGVFSAALSNNGIGKNGVLTVGRWYLVTYTIVSISSGSLRPYTGAAQGTARNTTGTFTEYIQATAANIYIVSSGTTTATIDNFTVRELTDANYAPDKMSVFAGVRKLSDTNTGTVVQLSSSTVTNNGIFGVYAPFNTGASADYAFISKGTTRVIVDSDAFVGPETVVLTGLGDISGPAAILRRNSLQIAASSSSQGTGNYGAYVLNIGTGSGEYTGREYETIVLGRAVTATELANTEGYMETQTFGKDMAYVYSDELTTSLGELITAADGDQIYMTVQYV